MIKQKQRNYNRLKQTKRGERTREKAGDTHGRLNVNVKY